MKYALGNMLNGAGGLNPDGLALDLQFAADKTLTARKGPSPILTRGSGATFVNSAGLIEYAPENLVLNSENTLPWALNGNVVRVSQDSVVAPNGTQTADRIQFTGGTSGYIATGTAPSGFPAVASCWVKTSSGTAAFRLQLTDTASSNFTATTTWQRFEFYSATAWAAAYAGIRAPSTGDNVTLDVWGFQVERATTARAYNPTTTAAFYGPRFDHDPVTPFACRGLLIEEGRTNLLLRSELLNNTTSWSSLGIATTSTQTAPDGANTAIVSTEDTTTNSHTFYGAFGNNRPTPGNVACLFSVFIKAGSRRYVLVSAATGGNFVAMMVDTQNWQVTDAKAVGTGYTYTSSRLVDYGNGWYRAELAFTPPAASTVACGVAGSSISTFSTTNYPVYLGNGSTFIAWGAQLEAGSFATSYIPTTTSALARSADVCSITGANFTSFWNRFAGTCIVGVGSSLGNEPRFVSNLVAARALEILGSANIDFFEASGSQQVRIFTSATYPVRLGLAYAINDYQGAYNGILSGVDTNTGGTIPDATALYIGNLGGTSNRLTGHIQFIRYYNKRLPNAKLVSLTV